MSKQERVKTLSLINNSKSQRMVSYLTVISLALLFAACLFPELSLATSLEKQIDNVGTLANGKLKTIGLSAATIISGLGAVAHGSFKLAGGIVGVGIALGLYLEWIADGMKFLT